MDASAKRDAMEIRAKVSNAATHLKHYEDSAGSFLRTYVGFRFFEC